MIRTALVFNGCTLLPIALDYFKSLVPAHYEILSHGDVFPMGKKLDLIVVSLYNDGNENTLNTLSEISNYAKSHDVLVVIWYRDQELAYPEFTNVVFMTNGGGDLTKELGKFNNFFTFWFSEETQ